MEKTVKKTFQKCERCDNIQAVKSTDFWGCGVCKRLQEVRESSYDENTKGKRMLTCKKCGHVQVTANKVWVCCMCSTAQLATPGALFSNKPKKKAVRKKNTASNQVVVKKK